VTSAREVSFAGHAGDAVSALLISATSHAPHAALLFLHWGFGDRKSFGREAAAYAAAGASSLLVDAPGYGARKGPRVGAKDPRRVRAYAEQTLGDLTRALDFSCAQPGVDPARIGFVGHSLGASIAGAFLAREPRVHAAVLMAGTGALSRLWLTARDADDSRSLEDLDSARCLPRASAALFFQFAERDAWIERADADAQVAAAPAAKRVQWYACDHALDAAAARDRARWLAQQLGFAREPALPEGELLPRGQLRVSRVVGAARRLAMRFSKRG
jgi:dienelactone hydrolase